MTSSCDSIETQANMVLGAGKKSTAIMPILFLGLVWICFIFHQAVQIGIHFQKTLSARLGC